MFLNGHIPGRQGQSETSPVHWRCLEVLTVFSWGREDSDWWLLLGRPPCSASHRWTPLWVSALILYDTPQGYVFLRRGRSAKLERKPWYNERFEQDDTEYRYHLLKKCHLQTRLPDCFLTKTNSVREKQLLKCIIIWHIQMGKYGQA